MSREETTSETKAETTAPAKDKDEKELESENISQDATEGQPCCPYRYVIIGIACCGMILVNAMRTNVGFTVMIILDDRKQEKVGTVQALINLPQVKWDTRMIGFLHSVFYIGYLITHLPAGYLSSKLPCHRLYALCIAVSCTLNLLLPVSIDEIGYDLTCVIRFVQGLAEGFLYPSCYGILRHWSTPDERGRLGSIILAGAYAGAVIGFPFAGLITHYIGWQYIFYSNGGVGIVWTLIWLLLSSEKPSHSRFIGTAEVTFLQKKQGTHVVDFQKVWLPWKQILTSPPVLALCICHIARNWVFILMLTNEPFYLSLFGFNFAENGIYSSIPHIIKVLLGFISGYVADLLLISKKMTTTGVRKLITGLAYGVQTVFLFILTFMTGKVTVIVFLAIGIGAGGFAVSGWQINHYDLSTRHASFLVGVSSTIGVLGAIAAPLVAGELTINQDLAGWRHVFYITVIIVAVAFVSFTAFGSGEEQSWATPPDHFRLLQKTDPLVRQPYRTFSVQDSDSQATDSKVHNEKFTSKPEEVNPPKSDS